MLSEGGGIGTLVYEGVAANQKEAGAIALAAGVDVGISYESGYMRDMLASVREGKVPMSLIDRAVGRILKQKFRLGLFEKPLVDVEHAVQTVNQPAHQELAHEAAREAIVLLKNDKGLLPLKKTLRSVAVIGPNADEPWCQLGDYAPRPALHHVVTVLEGIKKIVSPDTKVTYVKGCEVIGEGTNEIAKAKEAAAHAEVAIVVLGESQNFGREGAAKPTDGEGYDAATLELTGLQDELVKAVQSTGTPTVVVLINGRALAVRWIAKNVPAVVDAWLPGEQGGQAVAEVLFGDANPSGKLSVTFPRHVGQLPVYYNYMKSKRYWIKEGWGTRYVDMEPTPLYPFGHGLSYTRFEYSDLQLSPREIAVTGGRMEVSTPGEGKEHWRPARKRDRAALPGRRDQQRYHARKTAPRLCQGGPGAGRDEDLHFQACPDDLALYNANLQRVVEPGRFRVMVGSSSEDIRQTGEFSVK